MANIHITFSSKGGVGKSTVATFLIQKIRADGKPVHVRDTDPSNATLLAYKDLNAEHVNVMDGDRINQAKFDKLINFCATCGADETVVIDVGSSNFIEFSSYLQTQSMINALTEIGHNVFLHVVVMSGAEQEDTILCMKDICEAFVSSGAKIIIWLNEYKAPVEYQGKIFEEMKVYKDCKKSIYGIVRIPPPKVPDTYGKDMSDMLSKKLSFDEIESSQDWMWIQKLRINDIKKDIYSAIEIVV